MDTWSAIENTLWLIALAGAWAGWSVLHSLLATYRAQGFIAQKLGADSRGAARVRLAYNLFAVVSIMLPVTIYLYIRGDIPGIRGPSPALQAAVIDWPEALLPLQILLWAAALALALWTARSYDMLAFMGLRDRPHEHDHESEGRLVTTGPLGIVRHPWYLAGIILIWSRDLTAPDLTTNVVLTAYLWAGSVIEEHKLVDTFGDEYLRYMRRVPGLIPRPRGISRREPHPKS